MTSRMSIRSFLKRFTKLNRSSDNQIMINNCIWRLEKRLRLLCNVYPLLFCINKLFWFTTIYTKARKSHSNPNILFNFMMFSPINIVRFEYSKFRALLFQNILLVRSNESLKMLVEDIQGSKSIRIWLLQRQIQPYFLYIGHLYCKSPVTCSVPKKPFE